MTRLLAATAFFLAAIAAQAQPLVFETESVVVNKDALLYDKSAPDRWNVWSTDKDADKKWSGGVTVQSPPVMEDRITPEEGAPPLHILIPDLEPGSYIVTLKGGRDLGASLNGTEWKRLSELGWRLGRVEAKDGKLEFWLDDRYAQKDNPGFGYADTITLTPAMPETMGVANGGLEFGKDFAGSGWVFWSREGVGGAELVSPGHSGDRCIRFTHEGERDYALTNRGRLDVTPGQTFAASAWLKCQDTLEATLSVVAMGQGKVLTWSLASDGVFENADWTRVEARCRIPAGCDQIYLRVVGSGKATVWVDDIAIVETNEPAPVAKPKTKVEGYARERVEEKLDRGIFAMPIEGGKVYIGWRLLKSDPERIAFNIYRGTGRMLPVKLNEAPLTRTTDFIDESAPLQRDNMWFVKPVVDGKELPASETTILPPSPEVKGYLGFKLQGDHTFQKVGLGDLNGDGKLDYVIKQPLDNIDPYGSFWYKSPETYKLEAYTGDGEFLWSYDLGWGIERGIWYSPYIVYDFDGDGKAEVAAKTGEGDPRSEGGRVVSGPEYVTILDGETGKELARADWIDRRPFGGGLSGYNLASRNQIAVAYLDGKTPCLIVLRGTYSVMVADAYQFHGGKLEKLWTWDNREETGEGNWRGQGAHFTHTADVDGDGRDEVLLGSAVIDDDGSGLWSTGLGHPDRFFLSDLDPTRPGMEVFYVMETPQMVNGVGMADAKTGQILWGLPDRTYHVGMGMAADIDPTIPGTEVWASEDPKGAPLGDKYGGNPPRWLLSCTGELLATETGVPPFCAVYWDADSQRELVTSRSIYKYKGAPLVQNIEGSQSFWADIIGDWREELITSVAGELRIYTTSIPATDRRVCLLQDPIYRQDVAHLAMGYAQPACTSYFIEQTGPAMWLKTDNPGIAIGQPVQVTVTLSAAPDEPAGGTVTLSCDDQLALSHNQVQMQAGPGQIAQATFELTLKQAPALLYGGKQAMLSATLGAEYPIQATAALRIEEQPLSGVPIAQAEAFSAQNGGQVQIREDKLGSVGTAFSHWDAAGHSLSWEIEVPAERKYWLVLRYCTPTTAERSMSIDGGEPVKTRFGGTGGFGSATQSDWAHACFRDEKGQRLNIPLTAGKHTITLTNTDAHGMNLDYLALVPAG